MEIKFSQNLKILRLQTGLSQLELALKLNTTQRKISYWESGKVEPDLRSLIDLSNIFGVSVDYLIGKSEI